MYLTVTIDYEPQQTDGPQSVYNHIQDVLEPLLKNGWSITHYSWNSDKLESDKRQKFTATLIWGHS